MPFHNTQRLFTLLAAILVVCSFVAAPAAAASGTSEWSDSLDGSSSSSDSESTDSEEDTSDDDETEDNEETSDSEDDTETDSGDSDTADEETTEDSEENETATEKVRDTVKETTDTLEDSTESTTDTVDDTTDTVDDTTDTVRTTTGGSVETLALEASFTSPGTVNRADTTYLMMATDSTLQFDSQVATTSADTTRASIHETAAADAAEADNGNAVVMSAGATAGGQPLPSAPLGIGGAALSLSLLAGVAALRSTPLLAGGFPSLGLGTGISMPAILSKLRPFFFPLRYSRYDDSDPLEHEAREEVYEIVNESPGSYLSEVSEEADLPLSTTRHHIKILEREDLVSGAKLRGKRRFYPAYAEGVELAAALNDEATASIIDAIARVGSASVSDLADDIDRDPSTISHHLQRLEEDGIITREREGRAVMNKLSGEARTALEPDSTPKPGDAGSAIAGGAD